MAGLAPQVHEQSTDETRNISVDMSALLADGETLSGTPDVQAHAAITVTNKQVNAAVIEINNRAVPIGKAVLFSASSTTKGSYTIDVLCETSANQRVEGTIRLDVVRSRR